MVDSLHSRMALDLGVRGDIRNTRAGVPTWYTKARLEGTDISAYRRSDRLFRFKGAKDVGLLISLISVLEFFFLKYPSSISEMNK